MGIFGMNVIESDAVPPNKVYAVPPWITEVRVVEGVALRLRGAYERDGKTYQQLSPLTYDELRQIAVLIGEDSNDKPLDIVL